MVRGTRQRIGRDVAELAIRENRTPRSIRMTLSLAFLDPALIDAACAGTLPRSYGVTRLTDLPGRFADQWRALGLRRPARSDRPPAPEPWGTSTQRDSCS
jgi:hypothetical protein